MHVPSGVAPLSGPAEAMKSDSLLHYIPVFVPFLVQIGRTSAGVTSSLFLVSSDG